MMTEKTEIGRAWQLLFSAEEEEKIIKLLTLHRLPADRNGLKLFVLGKIDKAGPLDLTPEMQSLIEKGMRLAGTYIKKKAGF